MKYLSLFLMSTLIPCISYTMDTSNESLTIKVKCQTKNTAETMHMQVTRKKQHARHKRHVVKLDSQGIEMREQYSKEEHKTYFRT